MSGNVLSTCHRASHKGSQMKKRQNSEDETMKKSLQKELMQRYQGIGYKYYLVKDDNFPALSDGDFHVFVMSYNRYFEDWKPVSRWELLESGMKISKEKYIKELAKDGKKYPFDVRAALNLAKKAHNGQFRKDGVTPYIKHPIAVVKMLRSWGIKNPQVICVAYLHDVLEDTDVTEDVLEERFSYMVSSSVAMLTKGKNESKAEYLKRLVERDYDVALVVKCADRLCNTLDFITLGRIEKAKEYLGEAQCVFDAVYDYHWVPERIKEAIRKEYTELLQKLEKDTEIMKLDILELDENRPMKEQISFDDYKRQIYLCLRKIQNCSVDCANHFMEEYKDDFQEFYEKDSFTPVTAAVGMVIYFL